MTAQPRKVPASGALRPPVPLGWWLLLAAVGVAVLSPLLLLLWQSLLNNPFFRPGQDGGNGGVYPGTQRPGLLAGFRQQRVCWPSP